MRLIVTEDCEISGRPRKAGDVVAKVEMDPDISLAGLSDALYHGRVRAEGPREDVVPKTEPEEE